jgi:acetyl esterase/lipase
LAGLECSKVLVAVAEKDLLRDRGWHYYEKLRENGWSGEVEIMEAKGESHVFHLLSPPGENARLMLKKITSFLNQDKA